MVFKLKLFFHQFSNSLNSMLIFFSPSLSLLRNSPHPPLYFKFHYKHTTTTYRFKISSFSNQISALSLSLSLSLFYFYISHFNFSLSIWPCFAYCYFETCWIFSGLLFYRLLFYRPSQDAIKRYFTFNECLGFKVITIQLLSSLHLGLCNFLCWFPKLYFVVCIRKALGTQFHLVFGFLRSIL